MGRGFYLLSLIGVVVSFISLLIHYNSINVAYVKSPTFYLGFCGIAMLLLLIYARFKPNSGGITSVLLPTWIIIFFVVLAGGLGLQSIYHYLYLIPVVLMIIGGILTTIAVDELNEANDPRYVYIYPIIALSIAVLLFLCIVDLANRLS